MHSWHEQHVLLKRRIWCTVQEGRDIPLLSASHVSNETRCQHYRQMIPSLTTIPSDYMTLS